MVPVSEIPEALYSQSVTMWGGPELDLFHYPLRRGEIYNIGASYRDPNALTDAGNPKGDRDVLLTRFRDTCPHVKSLLPYIDVSRAWILYDRPSLRTWAKGRIVLLGDAAHPTYIYISQGACMALEDAVLLADQVSKVDDVPTAFQAYENLRYLRAARIQLTSRRSAKSITQREFCAICATRSWPLRGRRHCATPSAGCLVRPVLTVLLHQRRPADRPQAKSGKYRRMDINGTSQGGIEGPPLRTLSRCFG